MKGTKIIFPFFAAVSVCFIHHLFLASKLFRFVQCCRFRHVCISFISLFVSIYLHSTLHIFAHELRIFIYSMCAQVTRKCYFQHANRTGG